MELTIVFRSGDELRVQVAPETATEIKRLASTHEPLAVSVYQANGRVLCFRFADVLYIR